MGHQDRLNPAVAVGHRLNLEGAKLRRMNAEDMVRPTRDGEKPMRLRIANVLSG
jgi:hypothetical protein